MQDGFFEISNLVWEGRREEGGREGGREGGMCVKIYTCTCT